MCTNYVPSRGERLREAFGVTQTDPQYPAEAWPGYLAPFVRQGTAGERECLLGCFGLIPHWSRDGRDFRRCYNARSETVASKPSFRDAWRHGQFCIVPADAFFEPNYEPNPSGRPIRWRIEHADGSPMGIAGLWARWQAPGAPAPQLSFSLLTINADAHPLMRRFHAPGDEKRSVVVLPPEHHERWLRAAPDQAAALLAPFEPMQMHARADPPPARKPARPPQPRPRREPS